MPTSASVNTPDGRYLGETPLDLSDIPPQIAQFDLSLSGYEPVRVKMNIIADQTNTGRTNLLSIRFRQALGEARQYIDRANYDGALQAAGEALTFKPDDAEALGLQATATERLKAAQSRADAERKQAEAQRQREIAAANAEHERLEQLKRPRAVFAALCAEIPDAALFGEHELTSRNPAKNVKIAIVQALQAGPLGFQITRDRMEQTETYEVIAQQVFSLGILGGTERACLLVVGQTRDGETQILFKVLEYQIQHKAVVTNFSSIRDDKQLIPVHPSRMQMTDIQQSQVQNGVRLVMERIQKAIGP